MFPIPSHLPRTGGDHLASTSPPPSPPPDPVLDIFQPLFPQPGPSKPPRWSVEQVRAVRENLEAAITSNKAKGHELLIANYPSVSTNIRIGEQIQIDSSHLSSAVHKLEQELDETDLKASFLPSFLKTLSRHASALQGHKEAESYLTGLRSIVGYKERSEKLERAIWTGCGVDEWVLEELAEDQGPSQKEQETKRNDSILYGSKILSLAEARVRAVKATLTEQIIDALSRAVAFSQPIEKQHQTVLTVQERVNLQIPKGPRPSHVGSPRDIPLYPLLPLYHALSRLGDINTFLRPLLLRLQKDVISPLLEAHPQHRVEYSKTDKISILRVEVSETTRTPATILSDISTILNLVTDHILPSSLDLPQRETFLSELHSFTFAQILNQLLLPNMPSDISSIPPWLDTIREAVDFEQSISVSSTNLVIRHFIDSEAGHAWAIQKRRSIEEETRHLILSGWGGWEGKEVEREREITVMVEVEVEDIGDGPSLESTNGLPVVPQTPTDARKPSMGIEIEEGWGFDDDTTMEGGPSFLPIPSVDTTVEEDGWAFEEPTLTPAPPPKSVKPAREAKRLGKKVAKAKAHDEESFTSEAESLKGNDSVASGSTSRKNGKTSLVEGQVDDWGAWGEEIQPNIENTSSAVKSRKTHMELKEEKKIVKEIYLVSKACDTLVALAEQALQEAQDIHSSSLNSPSFIAAPEILRQAAGDVFDIYRAILPVVFTSQLRDVPSIAMQVYNDCLHLSSLLPSLISTHSWEEGKDIAERLKLTGEKVFEDQLQIQRISLFSLLDDLRGFEDVSNDVAYKKCGKIIGQVKHNLESLAKVLKPMLSTPTWSLIMGYLIDCVVKRISTEVLELRDIPEIESERINELCKSLHTLEEIFMISPGEPSSIVAQVPHWLKFCYLSELLQANLVDITYLFETGALVDFSTQELVGIIRALFADSEKRDAAIEKVERGGIGSIGI
ncbi:hypothetical protein M231_01939 [Tremella mesenterica]|uniref:Uncharacterized protein n=1 Tax=Tremella mesenterica TaxID=5217 RepID=A0A4Q1BRT6_TREME|nr:hypothetical protein M231_01939 [Tremella mesenterica]